jgi:hypothetical protein
MAAYLLGMGEMPAPRPEEIAVAMFNRAMDNPDENIDPHLRELPRTQGADRVAGKYY